MSGPSRGCADQPAWAAPIAHLLLPGEVPKIQVYAYGWRWEPADIAYDRRLLLLGGPIGMAFTGIASALANSRARRHAQRAAAPAWRTVGSILVIGTDLRLLVRHEDVWSSIWFSAVEAVSSLPDGASLDLHFAGGEAPYRLQLEPMQAAVLHRVVESAQPQKR